MTTSEIKPTPLEPPISDERLEALRVQVQYGADLTIKLLRSEVGAMIARIDCAEGEAEDAFQRGGE